MPVGPLDCRLVAEYPNEYDVYLLAMWAYRAIGQLAYNTSSRGIALAGEAIEKYPEGLAVRYAYAELLIDAGRTVDAKEQLEFAVASDPNFAEAQQLLESLRL